MKNTTNISENKKLILIYYAEFLKKQNISGDTRSIDQIISSYIGNIDLYLLAAGLYVSDKVINNKFTARNDYFDLNHLLYIDKDDTIVTNDKLIHGLFEKNNRKYNAIKIEILNEH